MKKNIVVALVMFLILFVASEILLRALDYARGYPFWSNTHRNLVTKTMKPLIPYRIFGWPLYEDIDGKTYIVSVHGERYPLKKENNTFRVVALGGSTTKNFVDGAHYPLLLQRMLQEKYPEKNIEVINVGNDAYATTHIITLLAFDVISWKPDLVIASENFNDLSAAYWPHLRYDYSNKYGTAFYMPNYAERLTKTNILFNWSSFYWFLRAKRRAALSALAQQQEPSYQRVSYGNEPPALVQKIFRRNLATFVAIAQTNNIPVILGTQPLQESLAYWDNHMRFKPYNNVVVYPTHEEFILHHRRFNDIIKSVAQDTNSFFTDNNEFFANNPELFVDFAHYTRRGLETLARHYADLIISRHIITP